MVVVVGPGVRFLEERSFLFVFALEHFFRLGAVFEGVFELELVLSDFGEVSKGEVVVGVKTFGYRLVVLPRFK